jgi:hypothetical protein
MNNSIVISRNEEYQTIQNIAKSMFASGYFTDTKSEAQAIVKILAGHEIGLPAFASMAGIHIIQGKPVLGANILATLVKNDPRYNYQVKQCTHNICELVWFEDGKQVGTSTFTIEEAKTAGLTDKDNWRKYPSDMLFARAISRGARRFAPGIFGGSPVYTPDEMGADTDVEGMIDVAATETVPTVVPPPDGDEHAAILPDNLMPTDDEVTTSSHGKDLSDLAVPALAAMANALTKSLRDPVMPVETRKYKQGELRAIQKILESKTAAAQ